MFVTESNDHYPVIIIGSGPAGMSVASELIGKHGVQSILLLESGDLTYDAELNELSEVTALGDLPASHYAIHAIRAFGGTSLVWAGLCGVLEPMSFDNGEWPFSRETLLPFYERAISILELPDNSVVDDVAPINSDSLINYRPVYLSKPVKFGEKYLQFARESSKLDVMLKSTVSRIDHDGSAVKGVTLATGRSIRADKVVLACGGVGNPRLLLQSGLDAGGQVGLRLMEHAHVYDHNLAVIWGDAITSSLNGSGVRVNAFSMNERWLRERSLRSFLMSTGPRKDEGLPPNTDGGVVRAHWTLQAEMLPLEDNRVTLGKQLDSLGQPRAEVNFHFPAAEVLETLWRKAGVQFLRENVGRFSLSASVSEIAGGGHLMGTTRMGLSGDGCVDENSEFYGCRNLFVAGSSVFPSGGAINPTFTIVALSLKLADHIAGRIS
ncbi:MAG: GMC family oxidoreductase [Pseudomonadales bacterium]|nr:GMC family oxidoreductase [Pseudomonadales bacterium]MBO6594457.1 GMC family oxidoreductase [Pseudomonadales bacterium]MBO6821982.1 GMC family oxidoreductase [Pseudomonadales bacterium]